MDSYFEQANTFVHHNASDITKYVEEMARRAVDVTEPFYNVIVYTVLVMVLLIKLRELGVSVGTNRTRILSDLEERAIRAEHLLKEANAEIEKLRKEFEAARVKVLKEKERLTVENKSLEGMLTIYREGSSQTIGDSVKTLSIIRSICNDEQTRAAAKVASIKITLGVEEEEEEGGWEGPRAEYDPDFKLTKRSRRL